MSENQKRNEQKDNANDLIIRRCIARSKHILTGKAAKVSIREAEFFISRLPKHLPDEGCLKSLTNSIDLNIDEAKMDIARWLKPLFEELNLIVPHKFWFAAEDLMKGYVLLYKNTNTFIAENVLFLTEAELPLYNKIKPGDILPFNKVDHILTSVKGLIEGKSILVKYAIKKLK